MKHLTHVTALTAALALTACGGDDNTNQQSDNSTAPAVTAEEEKGTKVVDNVEEIVREKVAELTQSVTLDTSSFDSFQSSLAAMKGSLSGDQAGQLTNALASLAKGSAEEKGGLLGAAKDLASGKSMEETLYEKLGDQLDGMSFEDILNLAS